jgi:hypothetical protein
MSDSMMDAPPCPPTTHREELHLVLQESPTLNQVHVLEDVLEVHRLEPTIDTEMHEVQEGHVPDATQAARQHGGENNDMDMYIPGHPPGGCRSGRWRGGRTGNPPSR